MFELEFLDLLPKKDVPTLENLAINTIATRIRNIHKNWIPELYDKFSESEELCESIINEVIISLRNMLISKLPYRLYRQLTSKIDDEVTNELRYEQNVSEEFRDLYFGEFSFLRRHPQQTTIATTSEEALMEMIDITSNTFECLTTMDIGGSCCTDDMISIITNHFVGIKFFEIDDISNLTNASIPFFKRLQHLEKLILRNSDNDVLLAELLMEIPTLKQVKWMNLIGALKIIQSKINYTELNIEKAEFEISCQQDLKLITTFCPKLKKISLTSVGEEVETDEEDTSFYPNLVPLANLTGLVNIYFGIRGKKIYKCNFDKFLKRGGKNITKLSFCEQRLKSNHIILMGKHCPNLRKLDFENCRFDCTNQALQAYRDQIKYPMFENLEFLSVGTNCTSGSKAFQVILSKLSNIKDVSIAVRDEPITDVELQNLIRKNPMTKLEIFDYQCEDGSLETIGMFVRSCKHLKKLDVHNFDDISIDSTVYDYIKEKNIKFDLNTEY